MGPGQVVPLPWREYLITRTGGATPMEGIGTTRMGLGCEVQQPILDTSYSLHGSCMTHPGYVEFRVWKWFFPWWKYQITRLGPGIPMEEILINQVES